MASCLKTKPFCLITHDYMSTKENLKNDKSVPNQLRIKSCISKTTLEVFLESSILRNLKGYFY